MISSVIDGYFENYKGLPLTSWQSIFLTLVEAIAIGVCFFLSLYFVNELKISVIDSGCLISFYGIGTVIGGTIGGKLSDRINPRIVLIVSLLLQGCGFFLLVKLRDVNILAINLFILGAAGYAFKTANDIWMLKSCNNNSLIRLKSINITRVASNLGLGLSGVIIGILSSYGFKNIFYLFGMLLFSLAIVFYRITKKQDNSGNIREIEELAACEDKKANKRIVYLMLFCLFCIGLIIAQLSITYPIYVQDIFPDLGVKAVSILFILDTSLIVLFQAPLINFLGEYNKILIAGIGALCMGLGMIILAFSSSFYQGLLSCVIWTTGEMLFMPMTQLVCYEKGAKKKKGQAMGLFQSIFATAIVMGPMFGGCIYSQYGGEALWYLSGVIGLLCFLLCVLNRNN